MLHGQWVVVNERLRALDAIEKVLGRSESRGGKERHLLVLDLKGPFPRAAISVGDVDRAAHVGVLVPGTTSTVSGTMDNLDLAAENLQAEAVALAGLEDEDVAMVSWLDCHAPAELVDAASRDYASAGAGDLAGFTRGVSASNAQISNDIDPVHITVSAHSYGAVLGGDAASIPGSEIDDVVVYGAPGAGNGPASGIGRFSLLAPGDEISLYHDLGAWTTELGEVPYDVFVDTSQNPRIVPSDGWERLSALEGMGEAGVDRDGSKGHSEYLSPGTRSHFNIAGVIAGRYDLLEAGDG